jgi:hypothetical protein
MRPTRPLPCFPRAPLICRAFGPGFDPAQPPAVLQGIPTDELTAPQVYNAGYQLDAASAPGASLPTSPAGFSSRAIRGQ